MLNNQMPEQRRLAYAALHSHNSVLLTDSHGNVLWANEGFTLNSGLTADQTVGRALFDLFRTPEPGLSDRLTEHINQRKSFQAEMLHCAVNKTPFWVRVQIQPLHDAEDISQGFFVIATDISELKNLVQNLENTQRGLTEKTALLLKAQETMEEVYAIARIGGWELDAINGNILLTGMAPEVLEAEADNHDMDYFIGFFQQGDSRDTVRDLLLEALEKEISFDRELSVITSSGMNKWVRLRGRSHFIDGVCNRIMGIIQDIDEQKNKSIENEKLRLRLETATNAAQMGVWEMDLHTRTVMWDDRIYQIYGVEKDQVPDVYQYWRSVVFPEDLAVLDAKMPEMPFISAAEDIYRIKRPDGSIRYIKGFSKIVSDVLGRPHSLIGLNWDITEEKQKEQQLKASEYQLQAYVNSTSDVICLLDLEGRVKGFNHKAEVLIEQLWHKKLCVGDIMHEYSPVHLRPVFEHHLNEATLGRTITIQREIPVDQDLQQTWIISYIPLRDKETEAIVGVAFTGIDITEKHRAEMNLRRSNEQLLLAVQGGDLGVWDVDFRTGINTTNDRWWTMLGYQPPFPENNLETFFSLCHPDDSERLKQALELHLEKNTERIEAEFRMKAKNGEWRWILDIGKVIEKDADNKPLRAVGVHVDFTQRLMAAAEKNELLSNFQKIMDNLPGFVYQFRLYPDGHLSFPYASRNIALLAGISPQELQNDARLGFVNILKDEINGFMQSIQESARTLQPWHYIWRQYVNDEIRWLEANSIPSKMPDESIIWYGYMQDITARKEQEAEIQKKQSLMEKISLLSPLIVSVYDMQKHKTVYSSKSVLECLGYQPDQIAALKENVNTNVPKGLYHPDDLQPVKDFHHQCREMQENQIISICYRIRNAAGQWQWIERQATIFETDSEGKISQIMNSYQLIDKQH
jgi:PAS domain S-box-containing protein